MKAYDTIRRRIRTLRAFIEDPDSDPVAVRVAQSVEDNLRWVTEDLHHLNVIDDVHVSAGLIRLEKR